MSLIDNSFKCLSTFVTLKYNKIIELKYKRLTMFDSQFITCNCMIYQFELR